MLGQAGQVERSPMRFSKRWLALAGAVLLAGGGAVAWALDRPVTQPEVSAPLRLSGRVVDEAQVLSAITARSLTARLAMLEAQSGPQLVIVTTPSLGGVPITDYALNLGRGWKVGTKDRNDGVLLVVAPTERKVRIEVGRGLEKTLTDPLCAQIIQDQIIPLMRSGDIAGGTIAGANALIAELEQHPTLPAKRPVA